MRRILEEVQTLSAEQRGEILRTLEEQYECGCKSSCFPVDERRPAKRAARRIYYSAIMENRKKRQKQSQETNEKEQPMKPYLRKVLIDASDLMELDLPHIWRERLAANGGSDEEARRSIEKLGEAANRYCSTFFKYNSLHPEVDQANSLEELTQMVRTRPITEENFKIFMSAVAKINMMHLVDTIRSQVNFKQMRSVSEHLKKLIKARTKKRPDMREIFTCGDPENVNPKDENAIIVKSVQVAAEKQEEAAARKYMDKGAENTGSFAITDIQDWIRFRVVLTAEDSRNPSATREATLKILGIIFALLGTDNPPDRLRHALHNGKTNKNSTGNHAAFHVTARYRYQCGSGVKTIPVEIQIRKDMDSHAERLDHEDYVRRKDEKNTKIAGMNVTFYDFVCDLSDVLMNDKMPAYASRHYRKQKERLATILMEILTIKDEDGNLINATTLREIYEDKLQMGNISRLMEEYKGSENEELASLAQLAEQIFIDMEQRYSMRQAR